MIQVVNFPPENRYLLDGNNTPITVTSDNANGYFRAKIYIDDVLFDEQGWSRKDNFTATKDLLYLYNAYFKPYFLGTFTTGLLEQPNFKRKVTIVIDELDLDTDVLLTTVTLPDFYLLYNVKSELFNDNQKLYLFGLKSQRTNMSKTGNIVIPFYANAETETVKVTIYDDLDNILHTETISDVVGKKVFIYTLKLSEVTIVSSILYLRAKIEVGSEFTEVIYNVLRLPNHEIKEIVFQNNFGFYIPAYFDGDFEDARGFKVQSYERYDNSTAVYAIEEDITYTINTGGLTILEKEIVNEVSNSIDCFFNNDGNYVRVVTATKKASNFKSRLNIYSEDLQFQLKAGLPFTNLNINGSISEESITYELNILNSVFVEFVAELPSYLRYEITFEANFPIFQLYYQTRYPGQVWSAPIEFTGTTSPQIYNAGPLTVSDVIIFAHYNGETIYSNIFTPTT